MFKGPGSLVGAKGRTCPGQGPLPTRVSITGAASTTMLRAQKPGANLAISGSIRGIIGNIQHSWSRLIKTGWRNGHGRSPLFLPRQRLTP